MRHMRTRIMSPMSHARNMRNDQAPADRSNRASCPSNMARSTPGRQPGVKHANPSPAPCTMSSMPAMPTCGWVTLTAAAYTNAGSVNAVSNTPMVHGLGAKKGACSTRTHSAAIMSPVTVSSRNAMHTMRGACASTGTPAGSSTCAGSTVGVVVAGSWAGATPSSCLLNNLMPTGDASQLRPDPG